MKRFVAGVIAIVFVTAAHAGDLEWSGLYRIEGVQLNGPSLDSSVNKNKQYGVHTLILRPKIVAADGLYINGQLNILNAKSTTYPEIGNQLGSYFGDGIGTGDSATSTSGSNSNSLSENQKSEELRVSQFYLTNVQEYGSLIVGRAPVQFGLGITHNAGRELFDHYSDTRDLVGYKVSMGNFFVFPMYAKVSEGNLAGYDDVNEMNVQVQYENPDSDATMGVFYQNRWSSTAGNDVPVSGLPPGSTVNGQYSIKNFNIFFKKETANYNVGLEVAQQSGEMGATDALSRNIKLSGFGVAFEYEYHAKESKNAYGIKAGFATGDNLKSQDENEGFVFDRNYDVAMFLFNHNLGRADLLHTRLLGRDSGTITTVNDKSVNGRPDTEAISNVTYFSPYYKHKWSDKWSMIAALTTGILDNSQVDVLYNGTVDATKSNLGYELDLSLVFNVSEKIVWMNQFGYFAPGDAWEAGVNNFGTSTLYGFISKAAVSF